jgi:hypothetical protein
MPSWVFSPKHRFIFDSSFDFFHSPVAFSHCAHEKNENLKPNLNLFLVEKIQDGITFLTIKRKKSEAKSTTLLGLPKLGWHYFFNNQEKKNRN